MLDKTITSALLQLRLRMIRSGSDLSHVDALLAQQGTDPASQHVPAAIPADSCARGEIKMLIVRALGSGPRPTVALVTAFRDTKPDMPHDRATKRVWRGIYKMRNSGVIVGSAKGWRLAQ